MHVIYHDIYYLMLRVSNTHLLPYVLVVLAVFAYIRFYYQPGAKGDMYNGPSKNKTKQNKTEQKQNSLIRMLLDFFFSKLVGWHA